jgi:hypothetical protein
LLHIIYLSHAKIPGGCRIITEVTGADYLTWIRAVDFRKSYVKQLVEFVGLVMVIKEQLT